VEAARSVGCTNNLVIWRHILPNVAAPVIVLSTLGVASAIITGAALSYLGLGVKPPTPEWGAMLSEARNYLRLAPWRRPSPAWRLLSPPCLLIY
jgi:peptide/nickel transport system permease protein